MDILRIHQKDNVAVALSPISKGETADTGITAASDIPAGHKIALRGIAKGEAVIKYGSPIGNAAADINPGDWVHTHNLRTSLSEGASYTYTHEFKELPDIPAKTFSGFLRKDKKAGIRNEIWIIPTVGCVNDVCKQLAGRLNETAESMGLDGIHTFTHPYGCSQLGDDHENTRKILAGLVKHPNAGGVLVVGLGCENNTMEEFQKLLGSWDENRVKFMVCQQEEDELETGTRLLSEIMETASQDKRQPLPMGKLIVGMKCGGSDGLSGVTANPVVGAFSDLLLSMGGSSILTEVPEMFGAETLLMNRCVNREVFDKTVDMVSGFKDYFIKHGQVVYENPSPGNKDGGITTLEDKSLGCVQKGGSAPVSDVIGYGDKVQKTGLTLLSGPGNDLVSTTALTAAGAQIILFTTGRGTPFGAPAVTLKISSNSELAKRKKNWIDFDAGVVAQGTSISKTAWQLLELVQKVAGGEARSRSEINGYREIAIFKNGVTL